MPQTQIAQDAETLAQLDVASIRSHSREATMRQAIGNLAEYDQWFSRKVQEGRDAVARGDVFSHEDIEAECAMLAQEIMQRIKP